MRASTQTSLKERKSFQMSNFLGLDIVNTPYKVDSRRASEMSNFMVRDGTVRKRKGWKTLLHIKEEILSMYPFVETYIDDEDQMLKTQKVYIVFTNRSAYRVNADDYSVEEIDDEDGCYMARPYCKPQMFINNGKGYIATGYKYLVYRNDGNGLGIYKLYPVFDDEKTYVPRTTIGISKTTTQEEGKRQPLDAINVLTGWRINTLIGSSGEGNYYLDGLPNLHTEMTLTINRNGGTEVYTGTVDNSGISFDSGSYQVMYYDRHMNALQLGDLDLSPDVDGESNIEVKFYCSSERHKHSYPPDTDFPTVEYIDECTFGCLFGTTNSTARLFLSGNPEHKNYDYHSEYNDLSYFPDINYRGVGSDTYAITGYARLNDNVLCVFKEDNPQEATIWFRTAEYDGQTTQFFDTQGTIGETAIGNSCNVNFYGDSMILTKNGLFGIVQTNNYQTNQRYAIDRTKYIAPAFKRMNLKNSCVGIIRDNLYFTCDGETYVCDRNYNNKNSSTSNSFCYEWWKLNGIDASCYMTDGDHIFFGTKEGKIKTFYDGFVDKDFDCYSEGSVANGMLSVSQELYNKIHLQDKIKLNYRVKITTPLVYKQEVDDMSARSELYVIGKEEIDGAYLLRISPYKEGIESTITEFDAVETHILQIIKEKNVCSEWYTPIFDFGSTMVAKTLLGITISAEQILNGTLTFGYQTSNIMKDYEHRGLQLFDEDEMDYEYYSFSLGFQNALSKKMNVRNFTFIKFKFANDSDTDFAINSFACLYKFNKKNIGVR